ncbi:MAG: hypothetical protein V4671_20415 [Armatimonadota bacterium]
MMNGTNKGGGALKIAMPRQRRRTEAGQSLIAAIIVLFLLLVLGAAFVALVGNNLRNAQQTARRNAADFYSEAGVRFMDEQLTNSAAGADWRPVPEVNISAQDPDYFWLQAYNNNGTPNDINDDFGGYTRVNFGGDTPGSPGGRALIRVTYRPEPTPVAPAGLSEDAAARKLIRLESIGRVGVITPGDPTTYNNTQAVSLRRELVAYKEIGITDYLRYFTNKDNKPTTATLGAANQVFDAPATAGNAGGARAATAPEIRDIESYYIGGGIRSNAPLTFYGVNRLVMNPARGEGLQVAGLISLANIPGNANAAVINTAATTKVGNPARVTLQTALNGVPAFVYPSASQSFSTYNGMVRDNPAGSDTQGLTASTADPLNTNLRSVPRAGAPLLDSESASGVTRYRALTRDAVPLPATDTGGVAVNPANAGANGWGENLYLANRNDTQRNYSSLTNAYSLRTDWLNPGAGKAAGFWKKDFVYVPPGITITLTPRYMVMTRSGDQVNQVNSFVDRYRFRRPDGTVMRDRSSTLRYTYAAGDPQLATAPTYSAGENVPDDAKFPGYPARLNYDGIAGNADDNYYTSNYVIYAEGNVRVRGVAGGYDPESGKYFVRHLTVVSGGTVYVDGNLLRDNVPVNDATTVGPVVKGQSSIALLARDYVTVNTSQFLATKTGSQAYGEQQDTHAFSLSTNNLDYFFAMDRGPVDANNTPPSAITNYPQPTIFFRHGTAGIGGTADAEPTAGKATIVMGINGTLTTNPFSFNGRNFLELSSPDNRNPVYVDQTFTFQSPPQPINFLYGLGGQAGYFPPAAAPYLELGTPNLLNIRYDASNPGTTLDYYASRIGIAPLDIRIEAVMYAQEGSFFIIPGPWLNPNPADTYEAYIGPDETDSSRSNFKRPEDTTPATTLENRRVYPNFPFYRQPQDIRITLYGAITENLPAEVGDQSAWLEKWGWVPRYQGATGLPTDDTMYGSTTANGGTATTVHGPLSPTTPVLSGPGSQFPVGTFATVPDTGNGIVYEYDTRASAPYRGLTNVPIRPNPYRPEEPLPITPNLPVAPGLLYVGERPVQPL